MVSLLSRVFFHCFNVTSLCRCRLLCSGRLCVHYFLVKAEYMSVMKQTNVKCVLGCDCFMHGLSEKLHDSTPLYCHTQLFYTQLLDGINMELLTKLFD